TDRRSAPRTPVRSAATAATRRSCPTPGSRGRPAGDVDRTALPPVHAPCIGRHGQRRQQHADRRDPGGHEPDRRKRRHEQVPRNGPVQILARDTARRLHQSSNFGFGNGTARSEGGVRGGNGGGNGHGHGTGAAHDEHGHRNGHS